MSMNATASECKHYDASSQAMECVRVLFIIIRGVWVPYLLARAVHGLVRVHVHVLLHDRRRRNLLQSVSLIRVVTSVVSNTWA